MRYNTPALLANAMREQALRTGGSASVPLCIVRGTLGTTLEYGWGPANVEIESITRFALDFGFEFLSLTISDGEEICNFWFVPGR